MERREFIKNGLCLSCISIFGAGCKNSLINDNSLENDGFYYKSKDELPKRIRIEACSLCQLNCPACTTRRLEKKAPKDWLGYLKFDDFKKFVDDNKFDEIELSNNGEIFLNPELDEIIKYAYYKNISLTASNGVNLNTVSEATLENLVKYKFKKITVSIDGATPETYKIYRVGGDLNTVFRNIKRINYYKEKYNSIFPKLTYQFIPFGHNEHEILLAKKKAQELNMGITFRRNIQIKYSPIKNKELVERQTGLKIHTQLKNLIKEDMELKKTFVCYGLFNRPQIDYNGNLLGCPRIYIGSFGANAFKDGLLKALNDSKYIYAKHMLTDLSVSPKKDVPCFDCYSYRMLRKNNTPLKRSFIDNI